MNIKNKALIILSILGMCTSIRPIYNITHKNKSAMVEKIVITPIKPSSPETSQGSFSNFYDDSMPAMSLNKNIKNSLVFTSVAKTSIESYSAKYFSEGTKVTRPNFSFSNITNYSTLEGVTCFRGNSMRDSGSYGKIT